MTIVDASTNLAALLGKRVRINRPAFGSGNSSTDRTVQRGVFYKLWHSTMLTGSAGGMLLEEPHGSCRGGDTGFNVPYGSTITPIPTSVPPLHGGEMESRHGGYGSRYRLWTAANGLDFDAMPPHDQGGPYMTAVDGWIVSTTTTSGRPGVNLGVWRGGYRAPERHALHDTRYDSGRDASRAAYQAGVTAFMVYEQAASRYDALHI